MTNIIQTVDILVYDKNHTVLLIKRAKPPFEDKFVLPGGHVETGESFPSAAARECSEEVGIEVSPDRLSFLCVLDAPDRDPRRGRRVSHVFCRLVSRDLLTRARAMSDAKSVHFIRLADITTQMMGFDHYEAIKVLKKELGYESDHVS